MIYLIFNESETVCKIGYTANDPVKRLKSLQTAQAEKLYISHFILGGTKQEKELHKLFANFRLNGELKEHKKVSKNLSIEHLLN